MIIFDSEPTEPPSISINIDDILALAAEIAKSEGHSNITTANVKEAFDRLTKGEQR